MSAGLSFDNAFWFLAMNSDHITKSGNKYILLDLVGTGGMAEVYRCKLSGQQGFEKIIVIKKLLPAIAADKEIVESFIDEARLAALLQHENIISIYDFGEMDGSYFIAMEYLFGKNLHTLIRRGKEVGLPMGPEQPLLIAAKICEGMEYAHTLKGLDNQPLNIIHRDLSPHNVFITYDGKVKIIDFGIAKAELYDSRTKAGVVKGKITYMSPEQLAGENIDKRSDIFAIGILLYEMLSGQRMYGGDTATVIRKCMQVDYVKLEDIRPDLPTAIYAILQKALHKDRDKRYQSCAEMGQDIDDCLFNMRRRVDGRMLKDYVRQVLSDEYAVEKERLSGVDARISRADDNEEQMEKTRVQAAPVLSPPTMDSSHGEEKTRVIQSPSFSVSTPMRSSTSRGYWKGASGVVIFSLICFVIYFSVFEQDEEVNEPPDVPKEFSQPVTVKLPTPSSSVSKPVQGWRKVKRIKVKSKKTKLEQDVDRYLAKAEKAFAANRLIRPGDGSSYNYYRKVLQLDPENDAARRGIERIGRRYGELAEDALGRNQYSEAVEFVEMGLVVTPRNAKLLSLRRKLSHREDNSVEVLLDRAQQALARDDLMTPADDCAYKYYRNVLAIDKGNSRALAGIRAIAERYFSLAEAAYKKMRLATARGYVEKGLALSPHNPKLLGLKRDLSKSKPEVIIKSVEKTFREILAPLQ